MSVQANVSFDQVVVYLDDIHRWMEILQSVPGFEEISQLKDVCSDISDTVDAARVELLLWGADKEAKEAKEASQGSQRRLA